jgi:deoxycytidylate deaminase
MEDKEMGALTSVGQIPGTDSSVNNEKSISPKELFRKRESAELVFAFSGPVGSGVNEVIDVTRQILESREYDIKIIKLSSMISSLAKKYFPDEFIEPTSLSPAERIKTLQDWGNKLREQYHEEILSNFAIMSVASYRGEQNPDATNVNEMVPHKTAFIIDQLKHPNEVQLLRTVYGNLFYLVGCVCSKDERISRLTKMPMKDDEAAALAERDRKDNADHGQQLDKTLKLADFFIRNHHSNVDVLQNQIKRFIDLIHGANGITPTIHEYAMHCAHISGLRSSCLSKQVGASISNDKGHIIATGCNDAPKHGGGLYTEQNGTNDFRCVKIAGRRCSNDTHKMRLKHEINRLLIKHNYLKDGVSAEDVADTLYKSTKLRDLIEFSRAVHAEMDALLSAARSGGVSVQGCSLYSTTYPCHNCAKHIVAAGIEKVYYIEPYEKSLALELHDDAIQLEPTETDSTTNKVKFIHFEGVSPRQYLFLFAASGDRKDSMGRAVMNQSVTAEKIVPQLIDGYRVLETRATKYLETEYQLNVDEIAALL